ncbi:acyl-CoA thioester hydrolase/BAAT C-terminal domain-containing protein [Clostridium nigeriense]|uniref:acyl-CoA thioester hydrolase/BAAT C-terminal domain-containing protein n=1 Tax=Clostridium nigeriense TaxID=1805470 RepID=UPI003D358489
MKPNIRIKQDSLLADSPFHIVIDNLAANKIYTIKMILTNYYCINAPMNLDLQTPWCGEADFLSNNMGIINIDTDSALSGSYTGINGMGMFWNCKPNYKKENLKSKIIKNIPYNKEFNITVQVYLNEKLIGSHTFKRYYQLPDINEKDIKLNSGLARLFYYSDKNPKPAIIVLSGSDGRIEKAQNIAQVLAGHGFTTMAIAYFGLDSLPSNLNKIPIEVVKEAIDFLKKEECVDSTKIGVYGRSKGAELALVCASYYNEIKAVVANSPSCAVLEGIDGWKNSKTSSWTKNGAELPFTHFNLMEFFKGKLRCEQIISYKPESYISVENIKGNILFIGSSRDEIWNAKDSILAMLKKLSIKNNAKTLLYSNCGHMLSIAYQPNYRYRKIPWERIMVDTNHSWKNTIDFLNDNFNDEKH